MPTFAAEIEHILGVPYRWSALFFSGDFEVFHGAESRIESMPCEGSMRGARENWHVSTVSLCIKSKPTPSTTTQDRSGACDVAPARFAFRQRNNVGVLDENSFAAQWLACMLPCQRFAANLAVCDA
jgi:hypothetical protein